MIRLIFAIVLFFAIATTLPAAAPVPVVPPDSLPKGAIARLGSLMYRGPSANDLTFSANGKRLLSRWYDKQDLFVWDTDTGKPLPTKSVRPPGLDKFLAVKGNDRGMVSMVVARDRMIWFAQAPRKSEFPSEVIVSATDGEVVSRFEAECDSFIFTYGRRTEFGPVAVSADGRFAAVLFAGSVTAYDLTSGKRLFSQKFEGKGAIKLAISDNGKTLFASREGQRIRRYELPAGKELAELEGSESGLWQAQTSPDGKWVVTRKLSAYKTINGRVQIEELHDLDVRNGETGKLVGQLEVGGIAQHFAFAGPESVIVSVQKARVSAPPLGTYSRWNLSTLKREWEVTGVGSQVAVSPDGKTFAATGPLTLSLYDAVTGKQLAAPSGHSRGLGWIGFSADGKTVTTADSGEIIKWAINGQRKQQVEVPELRSVLLQYVRQSENHLIWQSRTDDACATSVTACWDCEKNEIGWQLFGETWASRWITTADGKRFVSIRSEQTRPVELVTVYDGPSGEKLHEWSYPRWPLANAALPSRQLSADGRFLAILRENTALLLDVATGKEEAKVQFDSVKPSIAVSADGSRIATLPLGTAEVYDVKSGKLLAKQNIAESNPRLMKFSPDGKQLVMWHPPGTRGGLPVLVWDVDSPETPPRKLVAEEWQLANCVAFSPDGSKLAVGYNDGTAMIWDLAGK
jgi:WD40 repeat protein